MTDDDPEIARIRAENERLKVALDIATLERDEACAESARFRVAIEKHYAMSGDDLCIEDDNTLYAAFGLLPRDPWCPPEESMLESCRRFIRQRCRALSPDDPGAMTIAQLEDEVRQLRRQFDGALAECHEVEQRLGWVLGYPRYSDDPTNFPGATDDNGVCTGPHTAGTIAHEATDRIAMLTRDRDLLINAYVYESKRDPDDSDPARRWRATLPDGTDRWVPTREEAEATIRFAVVCRTARLGVES